MNKLLQFQTILSVVTVSLFLITTQSCQTSDPKGAPKKKKREKNIKLILKCQGNDPIVSRFNKKRGMVVSKGPVSLKSGASCADARGLSQKKLLYLKREGLWTFYNVKNRKVSKTIQYKNDKKEGTEKAFFSDSSPLHEGLNSNNKKNGTWKFYNAVGANCITTGSFSDGKKSGGWTQCKRDFKTKTWYVNFKGSYKQGLRHGSATFTNKEGILTTQGHFKADTSKICKENPPKSGVPPIAKPENCGKRDGNWKYFHTSGILSSKGSYKNNKKNGSWVEYYKNGKKLAQGKRSYRKRGFRNGQWVFYNKDGSIFGKFTFRGREVFTNHAVRYKNNVKVSEGGLAMGIIKYNSKTDSIGKPTLKEGGHWKFYEKGKLVREGGMNLGNKHGKWKFYKNGRVISEGGMNSNRKHGKWKFYKNGRVISEGEMNLGKKNGKWRDRKGSKWKTTCYMIGRARPCR